MFFKYYYGSSNSLINKPISTSNNHFSSKDRNSKLRYVELEHGHVYNVKHHKHNLCQKSESDTNIAYQKYVLYGSKCKLAVVHSNNTILK